MPTVRLPHNWKPRHYQMPLWSYLENGGTRAVEIAHRRWGKDEIALHWAAVDAMQNVGVYWHMLPEAAQARKAIWNAVNPHTGVRRIDEAFPHEIRANVRDDEMFIRFINGATWQVVGSDNFNSLVGSPPRGVVFSEYALAKPAAWSYIRPILRENGGWAMFITTPRGNNHAKTLLESARVSQGWFHEVSSVRDTKVMTDAELDDELAEYIRENGEDQGRALFRQEYEASFDAAVIGAYYVGELERAKLEGRITSVPYDPALPVHTYWDLGLDDATAVWFVQFLGSEIRLIEYQEWTQVPLIGVAKDIANKPYVYGSHNLPHDADAREMTTGRTRRETLQSILGTINVIAMQMVADGIHAVRTIFPRMWFDEAKCATGLEVLRNYQKAYDEKNKTFRQTPLHNWASHGADAIRQLGVSYREQTRARNDVRPKRRKASAWV